MSNVKIQMPNEVHQFQNPCQRRAGKCQMNVKVKNLKFLPFELWI
jgi:hypothetical protein